MAPAAINGFVAPGFEDVRAEFERNFAERGEIGAAVAAYWRGAKVVDLETPVDNAGAIQFYKRKGYFVEKTVPGYYSNHLDALVMRKQLLAVSS